MTFRALGLGIGVLLSPLCILTAAAEDNLVTIIEPADGAKLEAKHASKLEYEVKPVVKADHVHLYVDGDEAAMSHTLKGKFDLRSLKPGERKLCVRPVSKGHAPIGAESCITVTVQ
ncbi:hypothetical protein RZS28_15895 [Methylocapsa polymorpha]|uniref:DUF4399 domain-containing protein n=1 Tax=Methylocapsa polymorpha TaxID=3080828 RepID=A0ABZ0HRS6_9HYPH|nr:hypothetical protein RZS28_15895 [Methylocapsa sp. RX1]